MYIKTNNKMEILNISGTESAIVLTMICNPDTTDRDWDLKG